MSTVQVKRRIRHILGNYQLYLFIMPAVFYFVIFHYMPMYGLQIAFRDFNPIDGISGSAWVGLEHFERFINQYSFWNLIRNTVGISVYSLLVAFPAPILLALIINEIRITRFKLLLQNVTYAPHFISTVVMVSMIMIVLNPEYGIVNKGIGIFGFAPIDFMTKSEWFKSIYVFSDVWQNAGWGSIIYLAALAGISNELHEAAMIDGATRLQRIIHINIPGILPVISILFILNVGGIMAVGFEKVFLMQNPLILDSSEVIATYVYKSGLLNVQYSFAAAVGFFNNLINFILLLTVNNIVKRLGQDSLW